MCRFDGGKKFLGAQASGRSVFVLGDGKIKRK